MESIFVDIIEIEHVNEFKFLGIILDIHLTWKPLGTMVVTKFKKNKLMLQISKNFLDQSSKRLIYFSHFYSHLIYGIQIWGPSLSESQKKIFKNL